MIYLCIAIGASFGAIFRYGLSRQFNSTTLIIKGITISWLPWGTFLSNVLGGLLMGCALAYMPRLTPEVRALITTGFLGGLTTFSTFSAESFTLLNTGRFYQALTLIMLHVLGSLLATAGGFFMVSKLVHPA